MNYYRLISSMLKAAISSLGTGLYAVYKGESNALASLTTSLYAVYKGESNGNDSLGIYNATAVSGGVTYTAGKSGSEFSFNGVNGVVTLPTDSFKLTGDFSFSFWIYPTAITSTYCIFVNDVYSAPNEKGIRILQRDSRLELKIYNNTTTVTLITNSVFSANTRYFCTVTHSSSGNEITVNGVSQVTDSISTNAIFDNGTIPYIGVNQGNGFSTNSWFSGRIDELYIWNRKITATEIADLYNSGNGKFYQGNAFYSTVVNDSLGNYNGTAQGGLTYSGGKSGNAFTFNGTNAYILLPTDSLNSLTSDFSFSGWFYFTGTFIDNVDRYLFNNGYAPTWWNNFGGFQIENYNRLWYITVGDKTTYQQLMYNDSTNLYMQRNVWQMYTLTRIGNVYTLYINGVQVAQSTLTTQPIYYSGLTTPTINAYLNGGTLRYPGANGDKSDEIYIWGRGLSSTEVTELYNAGAGKFYPYQ